MVCRFLRSGVSESFRRASLTRRVDGRVERAPGALEQFVNPLPVVFGDAALLGLRVAYLHRLGAEAGVLREFVRGDAVEFGLEVCERALQVARRVLPSLAVDYPPFEFEFRGALGVEVR